MAELLAKHDEGVVTSSLDRGYATQASTLDPALRRAQQRALGPELW